jgi:hypothetical protein
MPRRRLHNQNNHGSVAQLVRAADSSSAERRFESSPAHVKVLVRSNCCRGLRLRGPGEAKHRVE